MKLGATQLDSGKPLDYERLLSFSGTVRSGGLATQSPNFAAALAGQ